MSTDDLLSTDELSGKLGIPTATLRNWRYLGQGPSYVHLGRLVRYRPSDVNQWLENQLVNPHTAVPS
jgi:predicted DNA-binding transcriptional regulator AlpA